MIKSVITNEMLRSILTIENNRSSFKTKDIPLLTINKLRKNSKKRSTYASNKIEGNPLSEKQVRDLIDSDNHKHLLKPEQEIINYYLAMNFLEEKLQKKEKLSKKMILDVQAIVEKGASKEKIGLRGPMPPGVLFAVYDSKSANPEYIPPQYDEVEALLDELINYVNNTDDHPLIIAGIVHYQLVTIHPFEDGNGRTARLISAYLLDLFGYSFNNLGSLEEYFAYDLDEYYNSLQMGLPPLYYNGRENPPHPEIWLSYFLRMIELYSTKVLEISDNYSNQGVNEALSYLNTKEKELLIYLLENNYINFSPIELSKSLNVTNKTIINRCAKLAANGFISPNIVKQRIKNYTLSEYARKNKDVITRWYSMSKLSGLLLLWLINVFLFVL